MIQNFGQEKEYLRDKTPQFEEKCNDIDLIDTIVQAHISDLEVILNRDKNFFNKDA